MIDDQSRERVFEERLHAIHESPVALGENAVDTSYAEMLAMFDAFLGEDFDSAKKESVIKLQQNLHRGQNVLAKQLSENVLTDAEYVDRFNHLLATVFEACENVLGPSDFRALFGSDRTEMQGYIDKETFAKSRAKPSGKMQPSTAAQQDLSKQTVLIVDNSKKYRIELLTALKRRGCQVLEAESGWVALEMLNRYQPDLMLVDVTMPIMTGYELVDIVHKRPKTARVQIFMMTSRTLTESSIAEAVSVGATSLVVKPAKPEELVSTISRSFHH